MITKTRAVCAAIFSAILLMAAATGNIRLTQIRSSDLQGNGTKFQTTSVSSPTASSPAIFDSGGKLDAGSRTGNTTTFVTSTGTRTSGNCVQWDANENAVDSGAACGGSSGVSGTQFTYTENPPTSSWSWVNQNSATVATVRDALAFRFPQVNGTGSTLYVRSAPGSTPWTLTARVVFNHIDTNYYHHSIAARESGTGKFISCGLAAGPNMRYGVWADPNTLSSYSDIGVSVLTPKESLYFRIVDDGTNLKCQWGDGNAFYDLGSAGRTAHMAGGANEIGIHANKNNSSRTYDYLTLVSWLVE
jgi:hypothetical protein